MFLMYLFPVCESDTASGFAKKENIHETNEKLLTWQKGSCQQEHNAGLVHKTYLSKKEALFKI